MVVKVCRVALPVSSKNSKSPLMHSTQSARGGKEVAPQALQRVPIRRPSFRC